MRKTLTLFFVLGIHWIAQGQNNFCGTNSDPVYLSKYPALIAEARKQSTSSRVNTLYIPVFYHLIGKSDKSGVKRLSEVLASHCELNQNFLPSKLQFYIVGIDSILDDSCYQFPDFSTGDDVMNSFNVDNVCNIYVNRKNPAGVCGYAFFPNSGPNGGGIFITESCYGTRTTTLTHEMGHYCGLPHTFESWGGVEFVNGTNCANAGDYFCDTPADFLDYRWTCPYNGNQTDPNGDLYRTVLDGAFYMSYANDGCHKKFSPDQQGYMYGTIQSQRANLVNNSFTGFVPLDTVKNGDALIGANVLVKGSGTGTITDIDGTYALKANEGDVLVFSYTGYVDQEVTIGTSSTVNVSLAAGQLLDEVGVVGYGTQKSKEVTSAVVSVSREEFNKGPISDAAQLLQGKVAGLQIYNRGGDPNRASTIRMRGISTVGANVEPLVVVDGIIGASLQNIDPNDIESMDVLKDGSAAAIYGSRGSSGVIIITTKKGKKGDVKVGYSGQFGVSSILTSVQVMDAQEFVAAGGTENTLLQLRMLMVVQRQQVEL